MYLVPRLQQTGPMRVAELLLLIRLKDKFL